MCDSRWMRTGGNLFAASLDHSCRRSTNCNCASLFGTTGLAGRGAVRSLRRWSIRQHRPPGVIRLLALTSATGTKIVGSSLPTPVRFTRFDTVHSRSASSDAGFRISGPASPLSQASKSRELKAPTAANTLLARRLNAWPTLLEEPEPPEQLPPGLH